MSNLQKICIVATIPVALRAFMLEHVLELSKKFSITLMANGNAEDLGFNLNENITFTPLPIQRKVSLFNDLIALSKLYLFFREQKFDCVLSLMPKSGLLGMLSSRMAKVPVRIHIFTGQVWFTKKGIVRFFLKNLDRLLSMCSTNLLADSPSQKDFLLSEKVVNEQKISVLGKGSISGVDVERFKPDAKSRSEIRRQLAIPKTDVVFLFMARLTHVKGIIELGAAFERISSHIPNGHLIVVGPDEENLDPKLRNLMKSYEGKFHRVGYTQNPEAYMAASDVFCIPSHREGFSLATIQAAGVGLPAIASRIYGLTDAVEKDVTGIFHEVGSVPELSQSIIRLYNDVALRDRLSKAATSRAHRDFSQSYIVREMVNYLSSKIIR